MKSYHLNYRYFSYITCLENQGHYWTAYLYLQKTSSRYQLHIAFLLTNHMINLLLKNRYTKNSSTHYLSLENMTIKQWKKIKSFIIDTNNCFNEIFIFIEQTAKIKKATKLIFINLTNSFRTLYWISISLLLSLIFFKSTIYYTEYVGRLW